MSEIKVGEYVRDKNGALGKITKVVTEDIFYVKFYDNIEWKTDIEESGITKHSPNIRDLIKVGDYVNGEKVIEIKADSDWINIGKEILFERDIKSIVTKERFEESEYRINE